MAGRSPLQRASLAKRSGSPAGRGSGRLFTALRLEHGAAAVHRATAAGPQLLQALGVADLQLDAVVIGQFLAGPDRAQRLDEQAVPRRIAVLALQQHRLAVRRAAVVDPAGRIAALVAVDNVSVVEDEQEGVAGFDVIAVAAVGHGVAQQPAAIFDQAFTCREVGGGEYAIAVDGGAANKNRTGHQRTGGVEGMKTVKQYSR